MSEKPKALAVSFNWKTEKILYTLFDDSEDPGSEAQDWVHPESFIQKDFPEKDGWTHFVHWNEEAGIVRAKRFTKML